MVPPYSSPPREAKIPKRNYMGGTIWGVPFSLGISYIRPKIFLGAYGAKQKGNYMGGELYGGLREFFFIGASLGSIISNLMSRSVLPLIASIFVIGIVCLALVFSDRRAS